MVNARHVAVVGAMLLMGAARAEDTYEAAVKDIVEKFEKIATLSGTLQLSGHTEIENGRLILDTHGTGTIEYALRDGKQLIHLTKSGRTEATSKSHIYYASPRRTFAAEIICDGDANYIISDEGGERTVTRYPPEKAELPRFGGRFFDVLPSYQEPHLLPTEKMGNEDVYVIEGVVKNRAKESPIYAMRYYFRKSDGVLVKQTNQDETGEAMATTVYENLKIGEPFVADQFKLNVPAGTEIVDGGDGAKQDSVRSTPGANDSSTTRPATSQPVTSRPAAAQPAEKKP